MMVRLRCDYVVMMVRLRCDYVVMMVRLRCDYVVMMVRLRCDYVIMMVRLRCDYVVMMVRLRCDYVVMMRERVTSTAFSKYLAFRNKTKILLFLRDSLLVVTHCARERSILSCIMYEENGRQIRLPARHLFSSGNPPPPLCSLQTSGYSAHTNALSALPVNRSPQVSLPPTDLFMMRPVTGSSFLNAGDAGDERIRGKRGWRASE
ncbi:hypothetical protein CEXT_680141 [Caerostris extrusa]|uniref:Uncharacterized protein n=1 Tax=Caerostris extrusa TaxID=172846 RepID=A0AAV4P9A4_CAEEX|nr:hypothetical protein CEXT_680141 [Caerostris extrusa]